MSENTINVICVAGFGYSGAGAVLDILKEFDQIFVFEKEFRLIKDPDGISDLENALIKDWQELKSDIAIRRFKRFMRIAGRKQSLFSDIGYNFNELFDKQFYKHTSKYIDALIKIKWQGDWPYHLHELRRVKLFYYRLERRLGLNPSAKDVMYFSYPKKDFYNTTKTYLNNLFTSVVNSQDYDTVVLDQALPPYNPQKYLNYFHKVKVIVADRDPRDIFTELVNYPSYPTKPVDNFIQYFKCQRDAVAMDNKSNNILRLRFEELIFDYENGLEKIYNFLGLERHHHSKKMMFFKPEKSLTNIGKWKKYEAQDDIKKIEKELSPFLYNN